jgi:hypothetical protein
VSTTAQAKQKIKRNLKHCNQDPRIISKIFNKKSLFGRKKEEKNHFLKGLRVHNLSVKDGGSPPILYMRAQAQTGA